MFGKDDFSKNYYAVLGVHKTATLEEIKKAYKNLIMKWHPDRNKGNIEECEKKTKEINEAYRILTEKKGIYDNHQNEESERTKKAKEENEKFQKKQQEKEKEFREKKEQIKKEEERRKEQEEYNKIRAEKEQLKEEQRNYPLIYLDELGNLGRHIYKCQIIGKIIDCTDSSFTLTKTNGTGKKYYFELNPYKLNYKLYGGVQFSMINIQGYIEKKSGIYHFTHTSNIKPIFEREVEEKIKARSDIIGKYNPYDEEANIVEYKKLFLEKLLQNSYVQFILAVIFVYFLVGYFNSLSHDKKQKEEQEGIKNCTLYYPGTTYNKNTKRCICPSTGEQKTWLLSKDVTQKMINDYCNNIYNEQSNRNKECNKKYPGTMFYIIDGKCKCPGDGKGESTYSTGRKSC